MNPRRIAKAQCAADQTKQDAAVKWLRYWDACQVVDDRLVQRFGEYGYTRTIETATYKLVARLEKELRDADERAYDAKSRAARIEEG